MARTLASTVSLKEEHQIRGDGKYAGEYRGERQAPHLKECQIWRDGR